MSLSQPDILDDVLGWTTHECVEKLAETLPRVLERLKNSKTSEDLADDKIRAIKVVCINLLPCIKLKDVENRVFNKLFVEITNSLNDCFNFIGKCLHINENSQERDKLVVCEKVNTLLRKIFSLLECCESCVLYALGFDGAISITDISSLPECVVYLVERTYTHCKESSNIYKDYNLEEFSEVLSMMFKKSHSIQINFLSLMDKLHLPDTMPDHIIKVLNNVCMGLFQICQTVMSLDIKLIVSLWKSISHLIVQYVQFLGEVVDVSAMIVYLCQEIKTGYQYLIEQMPNLDQQDTPWNQADEKSFQKSLKILGFEIKILLSLCKECLEFIDELKTDNEIYELLIFIHKNIPQWLSKKITPEHIEEINRQIVMTCEPLITIFVERPKFRNCLLGPLKITDEDCFAQLLVLITITKSFPKMCEESQNGWMGISKPYEANYDDIVDTIFQLMTNCHCELSNSNILLPGVMCSGKAHRLVSMYEYLATHICGFIGSLLSKYFIVLETSLLKPIFSKNSYVRMLAIDCWCFMDRYGTSDLCRKHINLFLDVFHKSHFHPVINEDYSICNLIRRLIRFLEPDDQTELMVKNSKPIISLEFWCICPIVDPRLQPQQKTIINNVIDYCILLIDNWVKSVNQTLNSLCSVILACGCINNILRFGIDGELAIQTKIISDKLTLVWNIMCLYDWNQCLEMEAFLAILIQLLPFIQNNLTDTTLVDIFTLLKEISGNNPSTFLLTDIVKFIENCSSSTFSSVEIPMLIQDILLSILANRNCVISHMTVEAITNFAEKTSHNELIPNCLKIDKNLEQKVINFINKLIIREINLSNFLKSQSIQLKTGNVLTWSEEVKRNDELMTENEITVAKQPNKRLRIEELEDSSHEILLKNLESDWSTFERLSVTKPVPDWFKSSARHVLEKFLKKIE